MKNDIRTKIFSANDIKNELVKVEEWDVTIKVKTLTGRQRSEMMNSALNLQTGTVDFVKMYPELLISACYDPETDEKLFTEGDMDQLNEKSGAAIEKIATVVLRLSGMDKDAAERAEKNLLNTQKNASI